ncbi:hypothetical protein J2800_001829 [Caulobacter rhizosphaerae]|uniref:Uncharacterized protein n=1 Tax=Caulobacter rhizosphaerae TaxID=2010972 RepID=A0ABU1MY27_9CAUL|nr:hypothetical protein [Caulobacter rhizosphaerae]MDR6531087.1 hypothetical protein [Caulobacter rhizosphaerae]
MKHLRRFTGVFLAFACLCAGARAQTLDRAPGESDLAFATRALDLPKDAEPHTTPAAWNGVPTLFVDYKTSDADPERPLVALQRQAAGGYRTIQVTLGEQEGGTPDILAIGFANADRDPERELIVILAWPQVHYDFSGTLYEVRLFDAPKPGQTELTLLPVSGKFGTGCECGRRDGPDEHYRFTTVAAVKAELKRLGY